MCAHRYTQKESKIIIKGNHGRQSRSFRIQKQYAFGTKTEIPFDFTISDQQQYAQLNSAILCGVLCEPHFAKTHNKNLNAIVIFSKKKKNAIVIDGWVWLSCPFGCQGCS